MREKPNSPTTRTFRGWRGRRPRRRPRSGPQSPRPRARVPFFSPKIFAWLRSLESWAANKGQALGAAKKDRVWGRMIHPEMF